MLIDGLLAAHITRGGKSLTTFIDSFPEGVNAEETVMPLIIDALTQVVKAGQMQPLGVEKLNGGPAFALRDYGAAVSHKGVKIGGKASAPPKRRGRSVADALAELDTEDPGLSGEMSFDD